MTTTDPNMERLFAPESIALVGASSDPEKLSGRPLRFLREYDYSGDVYPVNPGHDEIDGVTCYDSVLDLPEPVDVAMILLPAELTADAVADCGEMDVLFAIVIASGFGETDESGQRRESELLETAREAGVRLVGPNSEGVLNLPDDLPLSFSSILKRDDLSPGSVAFVTQSGAFGGAMFQLSQNRKIGTSKWISTGNEADLTTLDYLDYLVEDPDTDTVVTYVESLTDGRRLREIGRRAAETDTDIIALRAGASPKGEAAAASHTGSIATDDDVYDAVFEQTGVTRVRSVDEFVDAITSFQTIPSSAFPRVDGDRGVGVVSISGGGAVLLADACDRHGLPMATLSPETRETVAAEIPPYGSATNPIDVTAAAISDPDVFNTCIGTVADDENVSGLIVQFGNSGGEMIEDFKEDLLALRAASGQAMAAVFTGSYPVESTVRQLREGGITVFEDPVRSVGTMRNLATRGRFLDAGASRLSPADSDPADRTPLPTDRGWDAAVDALEGDGLSFAPSTAVDGADAAVAGADEVGYPVAMKLDPLAVEHKLELGGVKTGLETPADVRAAYEELEAVSDAGAVVQRMVAGTEVIVGVTEDEDFGSVLVLGPGGVFVELFDDFAHRSLPITAADAEEMIEETAVDRLLDGFRDRPPGDRDALVEFAVAVSRAYSQCDVSELEFNPVVVTEDDALAVDLLVE